MAGDVPLRQGGYDFEDFSELTRERTAIRNQRHDALREQRASWLRQAEVPFAKLTKDENWDFYVSLLQARIVERRARLLGLQASALLDSSYDPAALARSKAEIAIEAALLVELEWISGIPKDIREGARPKADL